MNERIKQLEQENQRLKQDYETLLNEHKLVVTTVIKTLKSVELWPLNANDNIASKAIKGVKCVITEAMINPGKLENRFSFLKDIYPLCDKYKDIEV